MFSHADAPAAISGEIGAFSWLDKKTDILKFVEKVLPHSPPRVGNTDPLVVADWVRAVLGQLRSDDLELGRTRRKLNAILHTYSQIKWTFKTGVVIKLKGTKCQVWN